MSKKTLIITPSWIGDCVMTQPLYHRLHKLHPGCAIDALAPKWSVTVFERMSEISRVMENPFGYDVLELKERWRIGCELRKGGYDQVTVSPGPLESVIITLATGIKQHTGYVGELRYFLLNDIRKLDKATLPLMVDRYTALTHPTQTDFNEYSDDPYFAIDPESHQAALVKHGLAADEPILAFCPGAEYDPARRWPVRHFAELGRRYLAKGWQVWLFGSQKDFDVADEINQLSDSLCTNLCGKTNLSETIDLLSCADTVVCNDSGLMHLTTALDRKLVTVYGSPNPDHTPPLSQKAKIASLNLDCSPCFKRECPLEYTDCLNKLTLDVVQKAVGEPARSV